MNQPALIEIGDARDADLPAIMAIHNHAVRETTAAWSYHEVDLDNRRAWLAEKRAADFPVLVALRGGVVLGYGTYGPFRAWDGYRLTVEDSVYVRPDVQRQGVGRRLLAGLVERARRRGLHVMIGAIEAGNLASIQLHAGSGFRETGRLPQVGAKFGRWLDLVLMQLDLDDESEPRP
jgi:phosphinothricin acetyltransferase